jgi:hypothetical protein
MDASRPRYQRVTRGASTGLPSPGKRGGQLRERGFEVRQGAGDESPQ